MVVDCSVIVTVQPTNGTEDDKVEELLFPDRHNVTLPLNGLNILFNKCARQLLITPPKLPWTGASIIT